MTAISNKKSLSFNTGLLCATAWAVSMAASGIATAEVANLTAAADTFINSRSANNNAGRTAWISVGMDGAGGVRRGLLRFDLGSIPAGSTVTVATLRQTVTRVPGAGPTNSTFDLFRLLTSWNEGTKSGNSGSSASTGEATWNDRMRGTASWTSPGARSDAAGSASASTAVTAARNAGYTWSSSGLTDDVQFWVDNPSQNFGWLMTSRAESSSRSVRGFASREGGSNAATLTVTYTPPPPPNAAPSASITAPDDGDTFISPANVTIRATAGDSDGTVVRVEFFDGLNSLGSDTSAPYTRTTTLYPGAHFLTATATDNAGAATTSAAVTVIVITEPIANDVADGHVEGGNAQSLERIYGKLLRIDVDGDNSANGQYGIPKDNPFVNEDGIDEIYAYGLRNPYTYSFDSLTGDLYLGDAGQNAIEEVDIIVSGGNYGWNIKEGSFWFDSVTDNIGAVVTGPVRPVPPDLIDPIAEYDHDEGSVVVAGYVYRGEGVAALRDRYVFGDWGSFGAPSARLFSLDPNAVIEELRIGLVDRPTGFWLRGFGQGADGELYVFGSTVLGPTGDTGQMLKIVTDLPLTYLRNNLVSDIPDIADRTDPDLGGPWGIAADPNGLIWIANNGTGHSTAYDGDGQPLDLEVIIPPAAGSMLAAAPNGVVFNSTEDFAVGPNLPAELIFATEDGTIVGYNSTAKALFNVDFSGSGAVYTGIALGGNEDGNYLYAANFSFGGISVFDTNFFPVTLDGSFTEPNLPAGYAPFNIRNVGGQLYVTYALRDTATQDAVPGPGNGYVNVFDTSGNFLRRLVSEGPLDSPWGIALAPGGFGGYGGALVIGNSGDGRINAFNPLTGELLGAIEDELGDTITIEGLRGLEFGKGAYSRTLYFTTATADGRGLLGSIVSTTPRQGQMQNN